MKKKITFEFFIYKEVNFRFSNRLFTRIITDMYKHSEKQTKDESILL